MLKQRVITAVLLLAVLLPALFSPNQQFFMGLTLLMVGAAAWEWGRLNAQGQRPALLGAVLCVLAGAATVDHGGHLRMGLAWWLALSALWVLLGVGVIRWGVQGWGQCHAGSRRWCGWVLLWASWVALVQAHREGVNFLLSILTVVWAADVMAYFVGRAFGGRWFKRKLAPQISPGKTWEGAWGGFAGVLLVAVFWLFWDAAHPQLEPSLHTRLWQHGWWLALPAWAFLSAMSVVGDLLESLVKRSAGVKDSSALLPGHGGVLDRIDALLPTVVMAMMLNAWTQVTL